MITIIRTFLLCFGVGLVAKGAIPDASLWLAFTDGGCLGFFVISLELERYGR